MKPVTGSQSSSIHPRIMRPMIVSASRATDIPAWYGDWFIDRLQNGWVDWINPFNGKTHRVDLHGVRAVVFWSKNPEPFIRHLDTLDRIVPAYYFHFTVNDYEADNLEPHLPPLADRIRTFRALARRLGTHRVIWRTDPLLVSDNLTVEQLATRIRRIGDSLYPYTERQVFSFIRIQAYAKVKRTIARYAARIREVDNVERRELMGILAEYAANWGWPLTGCAEPESTEIPGISTGRCIDDALLVRMETGHEFRAEYRWNMIDGIPVRTGPPRKDPGQRRECTCVISKDIGRYNTCPHFCRYCYAVRTMHTDALNPIDASGIGSNRTGLGTAWFGNPEDADEKAGNSEGRAL
ncbi:DUF1848 domain-containing protein [bacterium]|nr:DUF1848 domain-containing protein [candidate division CSSED10-310 bacterium]